jgi:hypothetical protein
LLISARQEDRGGLGDGEPEHTPDEAAVQLPPIGNLVAAKDHAMRELQLILLCHFVVCHVKSTQRTRLCSFLLLPESTAFAERTVDALGRLSL